VGGGGWIGGKKIQFQIGGRALVKPKNQPGWGCAGSLMAEMKHDLHCGRLGSNTGYNQPRHLPVPKAAI